ncbi:MAG: hypothetical protein R3C44_23855 [Chloroflexota bacterium]
MADTVIADGFRTWDEICVGDFLQYCPEGSVDGAGGMAPDDGCSSRWRRYDG